MSVTGSCACAVPIVPAASMRATPYVQICIFISIFRKSALRQTDLHDLFERQVAETLVGAALRGDLEFHRPPRRIAGRDRHADAHEVAKGSRGISTSASALPDSVAILKRSRYR